MAPNGMAGAPPARRELRQFAWTVGGAFALLAAAGAWRGRAAPAWTLGMLGAALLVAGAAAPGRLGPVYRAWMRMAHALSRVTTPVFMAVVYFGLLTPLALVLRLLGRRPLPPPPAGATAWVDRPPGARRGDMHRQF